MPKSRRRLLPVVQAGPIQRLAIAGLLASTVAACSSDTLRFGDNPFANPFNEGSVDKTATGSIGFSPTVPVQSVPLDPPVGTPQVARQPNYASPVNSSVNSAADSTKGWSAQGGARIYVGTSDSLATLSKRYNTPAAAILAVNGLTDANQIAAGQQLTIPVYNPGKEAFPAVSSTTRAATPMQQAAIGASHPATGSLNEQAARFAGSNAASSTPPPARQIVASLPPTATASTASGAAPVAIETPKSATTVSAHPPEENASSTTSSDLSERAGFRWPARGRVISGFGSGNEGINIAVPEGTPVKAAESGVVAYAGNELKGYGNLVLIRHDNGWVSAYANNGELKVKRGDKISRGQIIAKSGQTGNVTSPQLHFELRKGSKPVDPLPHLAGL